MSYRVENIASIKEFISLVDIEKRKEEEIGNHVDFLFRGQNVDEPLLPKLARLNLRGKLPDVEKLIIKEFKRMSLSLTDYKPENDWDWLSLAQHFGLPTRLLDWTMSAIVGLWFTVKNEPVKNSKGQLKRGVLWIFKPSQDDFKVDDEKYGPLSNRITKIFRPRIINKRISAQSGIFTVHKILGTNSFLPFEKNRKYSNKLIKIIIKPDNFAKLRRSLFILGIHNASIFPDLDGLCKFLKWRYSYYHDEK